MPEITATFFAKDRAAWRRWLERHGASRREIWLVLLKKHVDRPCVAYEEAVQEALCVGWIDGLLKRIDDEKHAIRFTPRKKNSVWSEANKKRVRLLIRQGRMTEAGMAAVRAGKSSGQWQKAAEREKSDALPPDLKAALERDRKARDSFARLAPSRRKMLVGWVLDAKREETRARRIHEVVRLSARGG